MITTTMNKEEVIREASGWFKIQYDVIGRKCDKLYNKAKILYRKKKAPVYVGTFTNTFNGTVYHTSTMLNFPRGTRNNKDYYAMLLYTYVILVLPTSGKKIALYINPKPEDEKVVTYGVHFLRRFYERMTELDSEGRSFEWLLDYFVKERGYGSVAIIAPNARYKDYDGPLAMERTLKGLELGWKNEDTGILHMNTFISEDMFHEGQEDLVGEDSEILELLKENVSILPKLAP